MTSAMSGATLGLLLIIFLNTWTDAFVQRATRYDAKQRTRYLPTWDSLDKRPLPNWYDEAKVGIFIHWGVFSVPSFRSEWFWYYWKGWEESDIIDFMKKNYPPGFTYADFAPLFTAELYNPDDWADLFKASGAKYVVLTTKHHEGFCNWPSNHSFNWNAMATGPHRDLVGDLAKSIRNRTDIRFGVYHSLFEWFNPLYLSDQRNGFKTQTFVQSKTMPELYELINSYHPDVVWSDGNVGPSSYWNATEFVAWLYNDSPVRDTVVTNDRWGSETTCKNGGFLTCTDRYNPHSLKQYKWENAMTLDWLSWGFRRDAKLADYLSIEALLKELVSTVAFGGNILINVGPTKDGRIIPIFEQRLRQMGQWLTTNGKAIYKSKPWKKQQQDALNKNVYYTTNLGSVFAMVTTWPAKGQLTIKAPVVTPTTKINLLGYQEPLKFRQTPQGLNISLPIDTTLQWVWVLEMTNVK